MQVKTYHLATLVEEHSHVHTCCRSRYIETYSSRGVNTIPFALLIFPILRPKCKLVQIWLLEVVVYAYLGKNTRHIFCIKALALLLRFLVSLTC